MAKTQKTTGKQVQKEDHWMNKQQLVQALRITRQGFDKWGVEPAAKIGRETFYDLFDVMENRRAYYENQREETELRGIPGTYEYEELRLTKERADNMALKNDQARAKLVPIELMSLVLSRIAGEWNSLVDALPNKIRRKHPALDSLIVEDIKLQCVKMQNAVARLDDVVNEVVQDHAASIEAD